MSRVHALTEEEIPVLTLIRDGGGEVLWEGNHYVTGKQAHVKATQVKSLKAGGLLDALASNVKPGRERINVSNFRVTHLRLNSPGRQMLRALRDCEKQDVPLPTAYRIAADGILEYGHAVDFGYEEIYYARFATEDKPLFISQWKGHPVQLDLVDERKDNGWFSVHLILNGERVAELDTQDYGARQIARLLRTCDPAQLRKKLYDVTYVSDDYVIYNGSLSIRVRALPLHPPDPVTEAPAPAPVNDVEAQLKALRDKFESLNPND